MTGDPMCTFTAGSPWCVNDPCPNPSHRTPDPETGGIVPPPPAAPRPAAAPVPRPRREPHCGHGRHIDDRDHCPYCTEDIHPDDYWDMVRFLNARRRDQSCVPVKPRGPKRDKNKQPNHTMRPCDICGQPMLLKKDRECAMTPGCTGWHTLAAAGGQMP